MQNLRKKPTFDELINYIEIEQPKIKYPDRTATFLRNSHYLSQFDGGLLDIEEQQTKFSKEQLRETEIRNVVATTQGTASLLQSNAAQEQHRRTTRQAVGATQIFDMAVDDKADEAMEQVAAAIEA